jgi:hypothetical protein
MLLVGGRLRGIKWMHLNRVPRKGLGSMVQNQRRG